MAMLWTPDQMLFLTGIALMIAILIVGELLEARRERARLAIRAEDPPLASRLREARRVLRSLPRAGRAAWQTRRLTALD